MGELGESVRDVESGGMWSGGYEIGEAEKADCASLLGLETHCGSVPL